MSLIKSENIALIILNFINEIHEKSKKDIEELKHNFGNNEEKVVDFLFEKVINVKYEVPEVVKGFFIYEIRILHVEFDM